jgi:Vacuolar protein sorting-associated protein 62
VVLIAGNAGDHSEHTVTRALAMISGLGGAATLVTVTGGAITWARFAQARIPAEQAVAATPNAELVTVGAVALVTFAVIGLLAVLVVYLLDTGGTPGRRNQLSMVLLAVAGVVVAVIRSEPSTGQLVGAVVVTAIAAAAVLLATGRLLKRRRDPNRVPIGVIVSVALPLALAAGALWLVTGEWWVGVMTAVAGILAAGVLAIARASAHFRWFGVSVFIAVLIFGASMTTLRTASATELQAVAVLLNEQAGARGISGLYVAETPERIYVADVDHCRRHDLVLQPTDRPTAMGRIMAIPRASVQSLAIAGRERLHDAEARGPNLLAELRARTTSGSLPQQGEVATPHPCADEGDVDLTQRASTEAPPARAASLASRFRPILRFDRQERWRPLNISGLMAERTLDGRPRHRACELVGNRQDVHRCEPLAGVQDLADEQSAARIIDFDGDALDGREHRSPALEKRQRRGRGVVPGCPLPQKRELLDCDGGPASAIYYRVTKAGQRTYVDYWWYLRFNDFGKAAIRKFCASSIQRRLIGCFNHEGDWEGVTVVSAKNRPEQLAFVDMSSHEGVFRYAAAELERDGSRPIVYVANGSHASYPHPCLRTCKQPDGRLPETNSDGRAPWGANEVCLPGTCLIALPARSFNAFAGRWGSPVCEPGRCMFAAGPKSPSRQRRYKRPWCFTSSGRRLTCDGTPRPSN